MNFVYSLILWLLAVSVPAMSRNYGIIFSFYMNSTCIF